MYLILLYLSLSLPPLHSLSPFFSSLSPLSPFFPTLTHFLFSPLSLSPSSTFLSTSPLLSLSVFSLSLSLAPPSLSLSPGKVLVHCIMGLSRSSTLVLAYLMIHRRLSLRRALKRLLEKRAIYPNHNFLALLLDLDLQLKRRKRMCHIL